jgi:hypothetical protein
MHKTDAMRNAFCYHLRGNRLGVWRRAVSPAVLLPEFRHTESHFEGMNVKRYALVIAMGLLSGGAVHAAAIDLDNSGGAKVRVADLSTVPRNEVVAPPPASMSELPEPEVFAMMLVGLILIGYRASRDSSEKFK